MVNKRRGRKGDSPDSPTPARRAPPETFGQRNLEGLADQPEDLAFYETHYRNNEVIARYRLLYSLCGMVLGLACILGGIVLFVRGVTGATSWTARLLGAESTITDAAPGAILFIVGLFFVIATRYKHRTVGSQAVPPSPRSRK